MGQHTTFLMQNWVFLSEYIRLSKAFNLIFKGLITKQEFPVLTFVAKLSWAMEDVSPIALLYILSLLTSQGPQYSPLVQLQSSGPFPYLAKPSVLLPLVRYAVLFVAGLARLPFQTCAALCSPSILPVIMMYCLSLLMHADLECILCN